MSTLLTWLKDAGKLRQGRRTPETVYASFSDNLDDRTENFPVTLIQDADLAKFVVEAVNEKLERGRQSADPEAWLADQLAQLAMEKESIEFGQRQVRLDPGGAGFEAVRKLAQEYGEMCAARATEGIPEPVTETGQSRGQLIGNLTADLMSSGWSRGIGYAETLARHLVKLGWHR